MNQISASADFVKRRMMKYGRDPQSLWLWPERLYDVARIERAYQTSLARSHRAQMAFAVTMRAVHDAGGVVYAKCRGNCEQPCFYRIISEPRDGGLATAYLDDHAKQEDGGMKMFRGHMAPEHEPIHMDIGEAYWDAQENMRGANSKMMAWRSLLTDVISERLRKRVPVTMERTAHVVINNRDYWFVSQRVQYSWEWRVISVPDDNRIQLIAADLDGAR